MVGIAVNSLSAAETMICMNHLFKYKAKPIADLCRQLYCCGVFIFQFSILLPWFVLSRTSMFYPVRGDTNQGVRKNCPS